MYTLLTVYANKNDESFFCTVQCLIYLILFIQNDYAVRELFCLGDCPRKFRAVLTGRTISAVISRSGIGRNAEGSEISARQARAAKIRFG